MKQTDDIDGLVEIAELEYDRLRREAYDALTALDVFWTRLYGPNETLTPALDTLDAMNETWNEEDA